MRRSHLTLAILGLLTFTLFSCEEERESHFYTTTLQGSLDLSKEKEKGNSSISYDSKKGENFVIWDEYAPAWTHPGIDLPNSNPDRFDPRFPGSDGRYDSVPGKHSGKRSPAEAWAALNQSPWWGFKYGIGYVSKGAKFPAGDISFSLNYLEIPIDVMYHYPLGPGQIHGGLGPYFAYGIGGGEDGISSFGENNGGFKRFDAGLNFQIGYLFNNGIAVDLGYDLGLANNEYADEDVTGHTRSFGIHLGYQIGRLFAKK